MHSVQVLRYADAITQAIDIKAPDRRPIIMKLVINACAAALTAGALIGVASIAFAQNAPGLPGGILNDEFRLQEHPQMQFAASAPTKKYQTHTTEMRKRGDLGDPNGCNLKCPDN
jgi:hypothetical protein